jgi:hypothetical protein
VSSNGVRGGWPSASAIENLALCPGSFTAQKDIKEEQMSFAALTGTRIHSYLEGDEIILNEGEMRIAEELAAKREYLVAQIFPTLKKEDINQ